MKKSQLLAFILFGWFCFIQNLPGAGVAVTKEQTFHSDKSAKPFVFKNVRDYGQHVLFDTADTRTISIERTTFLAYVEVPSSIPHDLTNANQIAAIRKSILEIQAFASRFPLSEPLLRQNLDSLRQILTAYDSGLVRYQRRWIPASEFEDVLQQLSAANLAEQARISKEKETLADARKAQPAQLESTIEKELRENSLTDAEYRVRERVGDGALIEFFGAQKDPYDAYVEDLGFDAPYEGTTCRSNLYFSGSFRPANAAVGDRTIRTFYRNRDWAVARLRERTAGMKVSQPPLSEPATTGNSSLGYNTSTRLGGIGLIWVNGYFRSDGTYVAGHYRSAPAQGDLTSKTEYTPRPQPSSSGYSGSSSGTVHVNGYTRKNGTYVHSYTRRR